MKYRFGICGAFDFEEKGTGGQSVKTREFFFALSEEVGKDNVFILESTGYKTNPIKFLFQFIDMCRNCENIIVLPAQNGIKIFAPLCCWFKGKSKVFYSVIGGWLPQMASENRWLIKYLKRFDTILVETNVMKAQLAELGVTNVSRLLNFKRLTIVDREIIKEVRMPLRCCYFSRVLDKKGIEDAIYAVNEVNRNGVKCIFDIYGPVVDGYDVRFEEVKKTFDENIRYCGVIDPQKSISVLSQYDIQIFPTQYKTEGIPGSIVDSYFAGVPVLASRWDGYDDVVRDGVTGIGFKIMDRVEFVNQLNWLTEHSDEIMEMKYRCVEEAERYLPQNVIRDFFEFVD